jgi:hypothetical protein
VGKGALRRAHLFCLSFSAPAAPSRAP